MVINCCDSWKNFIETERKNEYFRRLEEFVDGEYANNTVYPPENEIFNAFRKVSFQNIRVVILGQDPYHEYGQANGFAFAVNDGVKIPPSLKNIFREIESEFGIAPEKTDLELWASQGVFMLNTVLTVREGNPQSHAKCGWQIFTDNVIKYINDNSQNVVFMLWGANAFEKEKLIDISKHLVLKAAHPSPLSAYRGFFGCGHFKTANDYLIKHGKNPIKWN